jgi:hypothetical protein
LNKELERDWGIRQTRSKSVWSRGVGCDAIGAALIAAVSSVVGSVLTFIVGIRQIRRSVATSNGTPLGSALDDRLEHIELRLTRIEDSLGGVCERLAFEEGRPWPSRWQPQVPP